MRGKAQLKDVERLLKRITPAYAGKRVYAMIALDRV